ncbi:hypothetical protein [Telluribacter humicola]|nr:hypothetical protein [Telluribacter humicola]
MRASHGIQNPLHIDRDRWVIEQGWYHDGRVRDMGKKGTGNGR